MAPGYWLETPLETIRVVVNCFETTVVMTSDDRPNCFNLRSLSMMSPMLFSARKAFLATQN